MEDVIPDAVEVTVDLVPTSKNEVTHSKVDEPPGEESILISKMHEWLTLNKLTNVQHVFDQNDIELHELSTMTDTQIIHFAKEHQFDTMTTVRFKNACSKLHDRSTQNTAKGRRCCSLSLSLKLLICALISLYDIIGDIGLPFSFPWMECECIIRDCDQSTWDNAPDISSVCCNNYVDVARGSDCNEACGTQDLNLDFDGETGDWWDSCYREPYDACSYYCNSSIWALCVVAMAMTVTKEFFKLLFTVQLLWNDHLSDIVCIRCCKKQCCRLETIAVWCKDSVLFFLVILIKPSILNEMKQIDEEYGLDHQRVIFINLLMEDLWGILAALLIIIFIKSTFWAIFSLMGSILMVCRQLYVVRTVNLRKMKTQQS